MKIKKCLLVSVAPVALAFPFTVHADTLDSNPFIETSGGGFIYVDTTEGVEPPGIKAVTFTSTRNPEGEELAFVESVGVAETEDDGKMWLTQNAAQWDLAIVDLFLRQGSGLGVLAACRARQPHQRVVVLSNYATPDVRMRCAQLGVDAVFDKSNEIDALVDYCIEQSHVPPAHESLLQ